MSTSSRATVIITAYNAETYISRAIDSALNQTYGPVHVIVVDDGSSDRTSKIAKSYGSRVELIRLEENSGPAVGRTTGLMRCNTEFVAFLDSDDYWQPEFVEKTIAFLDANPEAIAVNTGYCKKDWDGNSYNRPALDDADSVYYGPHGAIIPNFYQFWQKYKAVRTEAVMMRSALAIKTGGQRSDLRLTQDLEFWGYLASFGSWGFIPAPLTVTDEEALIPTERLSKFKRRFTFFRDLKIDDWAKRIRPRLKDPSSIDAFELFLGHIATTIAIANAYTFRFKESYRMARDWQEMLDNGLGNVLKAGVRCGPFFWPAFCLAIRCREVFKAYAKLSVRKRTIHGPKINA